MNGTSKIPVWIDTDPSVLPGGHEVDDGLALAQAFRSPLLDVIGVSSVFGNADIDTCHASATALVAAFGPAGMAVHRGAGTAGEVSATPASAAIIAAARACPPPGLSILALGPITNIAAALAQAPDIAGQIAEIIWVAGRMPGEEFRISPDQATPFPDLNFESDVAGAHRLLGAHVPIRLAPWAGSSQIYFTASHLARLAQADAACRSLCGPVADWLALWRKNWAVDYFMPFDTLAVACAEKHESLGGFSGRAWVAAGTAGVVPVGPQLLVTADNAPAGACDIWFCNRVAPGFVEALTDRLVGKIPV
ncbi:MAG: nucleoside hydrolase [Sphingomonas sp.]|jgi:inosine-uridine nucleoside N-ribohydrolase